MGQDKLPNSFSSIITLVKLSRQLPILLFCEIQPHSTPSISNSSFQSLTAREIERRSTAPRHVNYLLWLLEDKSTGEGSREIPL